MTGSAREIGGELTSNPLVRKITFTGSTSVGKTLLAQGAGTVKKMSMELGGNAPFIVFDDADLDRAVEGAMAAKFRNAGQTCVCTNRFYAQDGIHDAFVERLSEATRALRVGAGLDAGTVIGPMIDDKAVAKAEALVADATAKGGRVVVGGGRHERGLSFFQPTVIVDASNDMELLAKRSSAPSHRSSASAPKRRPSSARTTRSSVSPAISTPTISVAPSAFPSGSSTASSGSTKVS